MQNHFKLVLMQEIDSYILPKIHDLVKMALSNFLAETTQSEHISLESNVSYVKLSKIFSIPILSKLEIHIDDRV